MSSALVHLTPLPTGTCDIISRASRLYDEVIVAVLINITKSLFTVEERIEMLREVTTQYGNVRVDSFHGLLVDFCEANGISAVVKGLRAVSDFDYELQMAQMNYSMAKVETMFMTTNPLYSFLSSQPDQGGGEVRRRRQWPGARAGDRPASGPVSPNHELP